MPDRQGKAQVARVVEALPSALFRVEMLSGRRRQATVHVSAGSGPLRVREGDEVLVQLSIRDPARGRIVGFPE